jgi:hypothetical protein
MASPRRPPLRPFATSWRRGDNPRVLKSDLALRSLLWFTHNTGNESLVHRMRQHAGICPWLQGTIVRLIAIDIVEGQNCDRRPVDPGASPGAWRCAAPEGETHLKNLIETNLCGVHLAAADAAAAYRGIIRKPASPMSVPSRRRFIVCHGRAAQRAIALSACAVTGAASNRKGSGG